MPNGPPSAAEIAAATERALAGLQTELAPPSAAVPARPQAALAVDAAPLADFLQLLTWLLVAVAAVLLVTMVVQSVRARRAGRTGPSPASGPADRDDPAARELTAPEAARAAAARGDFGEALRLLLGEVLGRFGRRAGGGWPEAWTSRQCLRRIPAGEPGREPLAGLVAAVERHHFGGRPASAADWEHWRQRAEGLAPAAGADSRGGRP